MKNKIQGITIWIGEDIDNSEPYEIPMDTIEDWIDNDPPYHRKFKKLKVKKK